MIFSMLSKYRKLCHDLKIAYGVKGLNKGPMHSPRYIYFYIACWIPDYCKTIAADKMY